MDNYSENQFTTNIVDKKYRKFPGPLAAGLFFSIVTIFLTYGAALIPFKNDFLRSGFGEVIFLLVPVLLFLYLGKYNIKETLKFRKTKPINFIIVPLLMLTAIPIEAVLNAIILGLIRLIFGKNLPADTITIPDVPTLLLALLVIGVCAAVCEEILFRGLISKGYENYGVVTSLVLTSVLFGILHRDIQKSISLILIGALIGFIVYKTKSIYTGMVAHFVNNAFVVCLLYTTSNTLKEMETQGIGQLENFDFSSIPALSWVFVIIFYLMIFCVCTAIFVALIYAFCKVNKNEIESPQNLMDLEQDKENSTNLYETVKPEINKSKFSIAGIFAAIPGILLILLVFLGQFLELLNINSGALYNILKALWLIKGY